MHVDDGTYTEQQRRRKHAHNTSVTTSNVVEEQCASAASDAKKVESDEAEKLRGWDRLKKCEAETGWKAGTSVHHSPFTVDVCNHSQLVQQVITATIGCGNGILLAFGDGDEFPEVVDAESRFRARSVLD